MKANKISIGQTLYDNQINEYIVKKIGRTYFECEGRRGRFVIETLKDDSQFRATQLYLSKQEVLDKKEITEISQLLRKFIGNYGDINLPLHLLRKMKNIITP